MGPQNDGGDYNELQIVELWDPLSNGSTHGQHTVKVKNVLRVTLWKMTSRLIWRHNVPDGDHLHCLIRANAVYININSSILCPQFVILKDPIETVPDMCVETGVFFSLRVITSTREKL